MNFDWTDERTERLRDLHAQGWSASAIGIDLGCSRNAVIGKAGRLGLPKRGRNHAPSKRKPRTRNGYSSSGPRAAAIRQLKTAAEPAGESKQLLASETASRAFGTPCDLLGLRWDSCRWPITDGPPHLFCNAPAFASYCPAHMQAAFK